MELSLIPTLAVFLLFAASSGAYFLARRTGVPHTVLLVAFGVFLIALGTFEPFHFLRDFTLTPEILFYIFLPTLIFESAYNINIRALSRNSIPIALLSIVSLLISSAAIAVGLYYLLPLVGFAIPFSVAFLFGSLISATDPVAVLSLFKEYGAPRRLALLFEGESLFNDGTGFALFLIALEFAHKGGFSAATALEGTLSFFVMIIGGALFGLIIGGIFSKMIGWARSSESVSITLTLVLAHVTFLLSEFISHHAHIGEFKIHLSAIIATTIAAMVLGNYGRTKLPLGAEEFVEKFWGQVAFLANSIIFILIGMLAVSLPIDSPELFIPIAIAVFVVASARALSIYPVVAGWNALTDAAERIPRTWQHLLAWGSLRGALAITMALLIPTDLMVAGWTHDMSIQSALLAFTTGCIFVTLFFKATTIGPMMQLMRINHFSKIETAEYDEARSLAYSHVLARLSRFAEKGYITPHTHETLRHHYTARLAESNEACAEVGRDMALSEAALRVWVLGIEKQALKDLYEYAEISEDVYKRAAKKLAVRTEDAERGYSTSQLHLKIADDIFEISARYIRRMLGTLKPADDPEESYMYYRALVIISHKVEKELARIKLKQGDGMFTQQVIEKVEHVYSTFKDDAGKKMRAIAEKYPLVIEPLSERLARSGVLKVEEYVLNNLIEHEMITPKVYATLREELESEIKQR
jgi:monovalent cation:H+ antiporter, CPA1 family